MKSSQQKEAEHFPLRLSRCPPNHVYNNEEREYGFTLLEVLVALAVLGMSLTVLLSTFTLALDRTRQSQRQLEAAILAQSLLSSAEVAAPDKLLEQSGATDTGLQWRIRIERFGSPNEDSNWIAKPIRISSDVIWLDHGNSHTTTLTTLRLVPKDKTS